MYNEVYGFEFRSFWEGRGAEAPPRKNAVRPYKLCRGGFRNSLLFICQFSVVSRGTR